MHIKPANDDTGKFDGDWKPARTADVVFKCRCGSNNIWCRIWESSCGGFEDTKYECRDCNLTWWVDGPDA